MSTNRILLESQNHYKLLYKFSILSGLKDNIT